MPTLLVKNIHTLVTMDEARREIPNGSLFVQDNVIEHVSSWKRCAMRSFSGS